MYQASRKAGFTVVQMVGFAKAYLNNTITGDIADKIICTTTEDMQCPSDSLYIITI